MYRLTIKTKKKKLISKKHFSHNKSMSNDKTVLISGEFRNSIIFLHAYLKGSLIKLIAISKNHLLKKFNIHNKKAEKVLQHKFRMRPSDYAVNMTNLFVSYTRIQNGLIEVFNLKNMHRVAQVTPFSEGMLMGLGFFAFENQLLASQESPMSQASKTCNYIYCFDSNFNFTELNWDHNKILRNHQFDSIVLDCCTNKHGLFVLTENLKIYQDMGYINSENNLDFDFQTIANFDSELCQDKKFTKIKTYLEDFLFINIGTFFVLFGICEKKANMIDLGYTVRDFRISEMLNQAVVIVENYSVVINLDKNKIIRKIDSSSGLRSMALLDTFVVVGGFNKKIIHFKLDKIYK
jgi:hypothetical protein